MHVDWQTKCLALLGEMSSGQPWTCAAEELYEVVLDALGEEWALKAVQHAVLTEKWRPAPAELRQIAARLASPLPNEGDLFQEFWHAVRYGYNSPRWSHGILDEVVRRLGGWEYFRTLRPHLAEVDTRSIWFPRFMEAWKATVPEWTEEVSRQLCLPAVDRDPRYRIGQPVARPSLAAATAAKAIEAPRSTLRMIAEDPRSVEMPSAIRDRLRPKPMPNGTKGAPALTLQERRQLQEEVSARAGRTPTAEEVAEALEAARRRRAAR